MRACSRGHPMVFQEHSDMLILDNPSNAHTRFTSVKLSFIQEIKLHFFGVAYVGDHLDEGWCSTISFYACKCK